MKKIYRSLVPTRQRLLFVLLVATPLVAASTLIRISFNIQNFTLTGYILEMMMNFLMIYPLALVFVPIAELVLRHLKLN